MLYADRYVHDMHYRESVTDFAHNGCDTATTHVDMRDRPLIVQFAANDADVLLKAATLVQPYCDAIDINLG